jgi:DNA (cytosine-5)-methyltransferase 1
VLDWLAETALDDKSALCLYPLYWALELEPEWITMEQVPTVLPLWEAIAEVLRSNGYSVWTGNVQAEQFGVPQTRKRAILLASRVREVTAPVPTHSKFHNRTPEKLDEGVQKWVSMAEALGWGMVKRPYPTVAAGTKSGGADPQMIGGSGARLTIAREREAGAGHWIEKEVGFPRKYDGGSGGPIEIDGEQYRARDLRSENEPAFTVTEKARSWNVYDVEVCGHPEHGEVSFLGAGLANDQQQKARSADQPSHTITGKGTACWRFDERFGDLEPTHMGDVYNSKGTLRPLDQPAMTLTSSMDNGNFKFIDADRVKDVVAERLNNQSGTDFDLSWPAYRPAAVVAGRDLNTAPGANGNRFNGSKKSRNDGVRVSVEEAAILQSFPDTYSWQGTKTSQFQQIGNAVPPLLGEAMIRNLLGLPNGIEARA